MRSQSYLGDVILGIFMFYCLPGIVIYRVANLPIPDDAEVTHTVIMFLMSSVAWLLMGRALGIY